jgi:aarF domain-containing kinase
MLEDGYFHADPHPGNLVATHDGSLAYFDFGMMGDIPRHYRIGLIQIVRNILTLNITPFNECNLN